MKPVNLHKPPDAESALRAQVLLQGNLASQVRELALEYQIPPAALIRQLVVDGLRARVRMREAG